ncbi:MAG TPA: DUF1232 domain-containing protein [Gemmatimonadaceae bacterium]|nr:DUF1232 domain-containing protein [Gemmatimonadaceae bacterium]
METTIPRSRRRPRRSAARPSTGRKRTVIDAVRELPNFLRLLYGLITDPRVELLDKLLVAGAVAYVMIPEDVFPDFIPLIGEVDDVFVLVLAIRQLMKSAGREVILEHWMGDPEELDELNLERVLGAASFFLPRRMRRRLRTIGRV